MLPVSVARAFIVPHGRTLLCTDCCQHAPEQECALEERHKFVQAPKSFTGPWVREPAHFQYRADEGPGSRPSPLRRLALLGGHSAPAYAGPPGARPRRRARAPRAQPQRAAPPRAAPGARRAAARGRGRACFVRRPAYQGALSDRHIIGRNGRAQQRRNGTDSVRQLTLLEPAHRMRMQRNLLRLHRAGSRTRSAQVCCMPASCAPHPARPRMQLHQHQQHARPDRSKRRMCGACAPRRATPRQRLPHAAPQQTRPRRAAQYMRPPAAAAGAAPHAAAAVAEHAAAQWPAQRTLPLPIFTFLPGLIVWLSTSQPTMPA